MTALRHELSCRYLQPLLDLAPPEELTAFVTTWEVSVAQLRDQTNWVSLRFCEALSEWLAGQIGADTLTQKVTKAALSPRAMGFLYPLLRAFGSPQIGFPTLPRLVGSLNKVSVVEVREVRRGSCEIEYRPVSDEWREQSTLICRIRRAQLAASPTLWGLPAAQVEEVECQATGGRRCLYRLRWAQRTGVWGLLAGVAVGVGGGVALVAGPWLPLMAVAGGALGLAWDTRRQVVELERFNEQQTAALRDAAEAAEQRFVELQRAKAEVDRQVEERTSELELASRQLRASLERLEDMARVKDEFVANVSHELRTPLTLILAPLEELLAGRAGAVSGEYLRAMHKSAVRLSGMVNDLLMLSRLQAGQLRLAVEEVELGALATAAVEQFRALAERKRVTLTLARGADRAGAVGPTTGPPVEQRVWVDAGRIEFVLVNLLANAFKFTPEGGTVSVVVEAGADGPVLRVSDSGVGIAPELQSRVFERFGRFENPAAPGAAGAGIGLALVRELMLLHGGSVTLESVPGQGSTFLLGFRRGREHLDAAVVDNRRGDVPVPFGTRSDEVIDEAPPATAEVAAPAAPLGAPRVLVVEDNDDMRAFIVRVLGRRYQTSEAADGKTALARIAAELPELVVSDVMMPGMSGYELCRALKADPATRLIPVLLLTAKKERSVEGFEAGADDYLTKPFNAQELLARIEVHLRLRRLVSERVHIEKLATLGALAAGMAHEVRNPAGAILAGLPKVRRALADQNIAPRTLEMIDVAVDSADRIARLVDDLLALGQPQRDGVRSWDVHEGLDAAIRILAQRTGRVELRRRFAFRGRVRCRPDALNQVFLNLIDNALHAVEDGGVVEVQTRAEDGGLAVLVADSGAGVPAAISARIFDPFFTTRPTGRGTGLGLHISQRVAADHGGRLELVPAEGWGACFKLWLPDIEREEQSP